MNDKDYIGRVLSHIRNKKKKDEINNELTDHIIEKEAYFKHLNYDFDSSAALAQQAMGDPDSAGEQLDAIGKSDKGKYIISILAAALLFANEYFAYTDNSRTLLKSTFLSFIITLFSLAVMVFAIKRNQIFSTAALSFCVLSNIISVPYIVNLSTLILTETGHTQYFFGASDMYSSDPLRQNVFATYYDYDDSFFYGLQTPAKLIASLLIISVTLCAVISVIIYIKTKMLKNRRYDYYIKSGVRIFLSAITLCVALAFIFECYNLCDFNNNYQSIISQELNSTNQTIIDRLTEYKATGKWHTEDLRGNYIRAELHETKYAVSSTEQLYKLNGDQINIFSAVKGEQIINFVKNKKSLGDAPKPYELSYNDEEDILTVKYDCEYGKSLLYFKYADGDFLIDSYFTYQQKELYDNALKKYCTEIYPEIFKTFPNAEIINDSEIKGVILNRADSTFEICQEFDPILITEIDGKLYNIYTPIEKCGTFLFTVSFDDNEARIKKAENLFEKSDRNNDIYFDSDSFENKSERIYNSINREVEGTVHLDKSGSYYTVKENRTYTYD